jgi:hypothetical protein
VRIPVEVYGDSGDVWSIMDVLPSKDCTESGGVIVNGTEHAVKEKGCQYDTLRSKSQEENKRK